MKGVQPPGPQEPPLRAGDASQITPPHAAIRPTSAALHMGWPPCHSHESRSERRPVLAFEATATSCRASNPHKAGGTLAYDLVRKKGSFVHPGERHKLQNSGYFLQRHAVRKMHFITAPHERGVMHFSGLRTGTFVPPAASNA